MKIFCSIPEPGSPYYQAEQYEHDQKKTLQAEWIGDSLGPSERLLVSGAASCGKRLYG